MVRRIVFLLLLSISIAALNSADMTKQELILETVVPENYGIHVPDEALSLDQFLFEFSTDNGTSELLTDSRFSIGSFEDMNMQSFTLIYYGNLSSEYNVVIRADSLNGFINQDSDGYSIPVSVSYSEPEDKPEDIRITDDEEYGVCSVIIPPAGPRRGVDVVNLEISWDEQRDLRPGTYEMALNIELLNNA